MKKIIRINFIFFFITQLFSQKIIYNNDIFSMIDQTYFANDYRKILNNYSLIFSQSFYYNTNLPNLENINGISINKGFGAISSILFRYQNRIFKLSAEPQIIRNNNYPLNVPKKTGLFSVLNDVPINNLNIYPISNLKNLGIQINTMWFSGGYGNWNKWWGPGIHNSLVLTNNAEGFYHYFINTNGYKKITSKIKYSFEYMITEGIKNTNQLKYFLSAWFLNIKYNDVEYGLSRHVISGGNKDLDWILSDASKVLLTNKNLKYWDEVYDFYIAYKPKNSGLYAFIELGVPNRYFNGYDRFIYMDHAMGSNIGLRKLGIFGNQYIIVGFEYERLLQGAYYNTIPTPNWYDNIRYNYSSYNGRRWGSHAGSDSDDFLIYLGYNNKKISFLYGLNYERHGITYHFPPEVKLESRISFSFNVGSTTIDINYENEYFEHYGFVDNNRNVWDETYELGSIQRTQTLLFSIRHRFIY